MTNGFTATLTRLALLLTAYVSAAACAPARAVTPTVEAVAAVRPISRSELLHRAKPLLLQLHASQQAHSVQESEIYRELLRKMIDERLEEHEADLAHISVSTGEIDRAIKDIAAGESVEPALAAAEAQREWMTEQDYRDVIRRQLIERKVVQLRLGGLVRIDEDDGRALYRRLLRERVGPATTEVRILAWHIPPGADAAEIEAHEQVAATILARARGGEDLCKVAQYSIVHSTCGSRGHVPFDDLVPDVRDAIANLKRGEFSEPISIGTSPIEAILIVQLQGAPRLPEYGEVRDEMMRRAYSEALERQRRAWLEELRRRTAVPFVDDAAPRNGDEM